MAHTYKRPKERDSRDFDKTQLRENGLQQTVLHRDYSAHFFRWCFARRYITLKTTVLEVGCGQDRPLSKLLTRSVSNHVDHYVGVDINKLQPQKNQRLEFHSEFNFVTEHKKLIKDRLFDVVVHLEVIEHMKVEHGRKMLRNCHECLKPGGLMIMSTPCYDGKRHAANHVHEYTVEELQKEAEKAGFEIVDRFGCFMDIKHIGKPKKTGDKDLDDAVSLVYDKLNKYYDNDALSCIFAPLYPDNARNNLWVCKKIDKKGKK